MGRQVNRWISAVAALLAMGAVARAGEGDVVTGGLGVELDRIVQRITGGGFWGAVLVAKDGEVVLARGYGHADYGSTPNRSTTRFEIASASKPFAATAILKLEADGKLSLSDGLATFFPDVPEDKRGVTVRHLLTHTSGMRPDLGLPYSSTASREEFVRYVLAAPLAAAPGEKFAYFNSGYALLAALVEEVAGGPFEDYLRAAVFEPAGMSSTGFIKDTLPAGAEVATRLSERTPGATAADWYWGWGYRGMGGIVTTVWDLFRFDRALRDGKVLSKGIQKKAWEPALAGYALGWKVDATPRGTTKVHHSGGVEGFACNYVRFLEDDALIVILSNGRTNIHEVTEKIEAELFPAPRIRIRLDPGPLELTPFKTLTLESGVEWKVDRQDDEVVLALRHRRKRHVFAEILMPRAAAAHLEAKLGAQAGVRVGAPSGMEAGMYLQPYDLSATPLLVEDGLEVQVLPRYQGRDADGRVVGDDRATLIVADSIRGQWPIMVKMDGPSLDKLLKAMKKALQGK